MDRELLRFAWTLAHCFFLSFPFLRRQQSVTRLSQEHDDKPPHRSNSHLVPLQPGLPSHWWSRQGAVCTLKYDLYIVGIRVACVTFLTAARADLKQTSLQVVLQLAYALRSHRTRLRSLSKTPLRRRVQASVFWERTTLHSSALRVGTSCSQSFSSVSNVARPRTSSWWSCPLSMFSLCVAPSSESSRQIRFFQGPHSVCASAAPQNQRTKDRQRTANQTRILSSGTSTLTVCTHLFRRLKSKNASQSDACRCCTWNYSLSVRNRRHHDSPRTYTSVARKTSTNLS